MREGTSFQTEWTLLSQSSSQLRLDLPGGRFPNEMSYAIRLTSTPSLFNNIKWGYCMTGKSLWEIKSLNYSKKIHLRLWNLKVHDSFHKSQSLSQINRIHTNTSVRIPILILSIPLRLGLASCLFLPGFQNIILYAFITSPMHATCPAHLIHIDWYPNIWRNSMCLSWQYYATHWIAVVKPNGMPSIPNLTCL